MPDAFLSSLSHLKLSNFRNHQLIQYDSLSEGPIVLTGKNGVGKTNILEAISLLTPSKGLKSAKISELNNQAYPDNFWQITAQLKTVYGPKEITTRRNIKANSKLENRIVMIDGQIIKKKSELAELLQVIWLTPPMQQLFTTSSSVRRSFFDQIVGNFFPSHSSSLSKYENSTRERLRLLKTNQNDEYWLNALENNMEKEAAIICNARMETLTLLSKAISDNPSPFPKAQLSLSHGDLPAEFLEKLKSNRRHDAVSGRTNLGPHLYDLEVNFKDKNMNAKFCSTGEQKALLLSLVFAQVLAIIDKFNIIPILLFDEIISHLDGKNRELLFNEILNIKAQAWLSGVDPNSFSLIKTKAQFIAL